MPLRARGKWILLSASGLALVFGAERALRHHYYSATHRYYEAGEVYWEDSQTLLLFSPDRYLFWALKPGIRLKLAETPEQYGAYLPDPRRVPYSFEVRTDSHGYNSPEFDCRHNNGALRIVALGDSRTMAEGVPHEDVYARRLERLLQSRYADRRVEVINAGVSGYSSYQGLVQLERELLPCKPDVVTVLFGINDQDVDQGISDRAKARLFDTPLMTLRSWSNRSMIVYGLRAAFWHLKGALIGKTPVAPVVYAQGGSRAARVSTDEYADNLETIAGLGAAHGFRPLFLILPTSPYAYFPGLFPEEEALPQATEQALGEAESLLPKDPRAALSSLRQLLGEHPRSTRTRYLLARCLRYLGRNEEAHGLFVEANRSIVFGKYEGVVRSVAAERGIAVADLTPEFTALRREPLYVDDMHPNALGHELIAERLMDMIAGPR